MIKNCICCDTEFDDNGRSHKKFCSDFCRYKFKSSKERLENPEKGKARKKKYYTALKKDTQRYDDYLKNNRLGIYKKQGLTSDLIECRELIVSIKKELKNGS